MPESLLSMFKEAQTLQRMKRSVLRISFIGIISLLLLVGIIYNSTPGLDGSVNGNVSLAVTPLQFLPKSIFYLKTVSIPLLKFRVF
jgi:hypothetical protein